MAAASRDQALSLLAAANNHGDLAVKLSSLKQVRGILSSADPSLAAELFPYLVELQSSPEILVRKSLIEIIEDTGLKAMEYSYVLMPVLLAFLRDDDSSVIGKSIVCGTHFFCRVVEEGTLQFHWHGKVERWLEELWTWMLRFKDVVFAIVLEDRPGLVGRKLLALKFLETYVLLFTSDKNDFEKCNKEGSKRTFNISWLLAGHPFLDPLALTSEANRLLGTLMDLLQSACNLPGSVTITIVNCLAAIGRKRPLHYSTIFSALLEFSPNFEIAKGCHTASVLYSLRTAFLGFLRCTNPTILESRDKLLKALGAMNAGDAADQAVRQVDKMIRNSERAREIRLGRDDQPSTQLPLSGDLLRKRSMPQDNEEQNNGLDAASKRVRYGPNSHLALSAPINDSRHESVSLNGVSPNIPLLDSDLTPVEKMISMIAALLAEGERGAESLELLISNMHPDLLADIVITNMKHLPKIPPPLTRRGNLPVTLPISSVNSPAHVAGLSSEINTTQSPLVTAQVEVPPSVASFSSSLSDSCCTSAADSKRDPRRDPRRLDPRRLATPVGVPSVPTTEDVGPNPMQSDFNDSSSITRPPSLDVMAAVENFPAPVITGVKSDDMTFVSPAVSKIDQLNLEEGLVRSKELITVPEVSASLDHEIPSCAVNEDSAALDLSDAEVNGTNVPSLLESDQHSSAVSIASAWEETCKDLPPLPIFVELTEEEQKSVRKLAVQRIFESYKHLHGTECQTRMGLLARLIAQLDADEDIVTMLQKCVVLDYQEQKGHELVLHILYHLQSLMISSSSPNSSYASAVYGKLLLAVAKSLLDTFPASDKSFSRLLGEVPVLPDSVLELLNNLCFSALFDLHGKEVPDGERVTQGLGAVWSLILGRPNYRQACLDIALKCAAHSQDEIRAKAIRLVSNKLYQLSYLRENIEQYATNMMISAVNQHSSKLEQSQSGSADLRAEVVGSQETSISGSQVSEPGTFEMDSVMQAQPISHSALTVSFPEAQRLTSLFFALCTKKPSLLQLIFDNYVQAPKSVKQAFHRHIPILIRALGSSCSELLNIISNPPQGSENLLTLVLQVLTQETTPSPNLIATVKHLYETKLKDATILIPMLSSLTKNEVLPIFPRLVDLPLEKFQMALAHILQGSAHTGPALTPVEVLVAIHDIVPEKDGLPLKKITDACSACFEQRTVFTQQVLAKALNQMVDQTPLPLLFMRTVIQAIDAFPTLVDFVMEILSKLVSKQVWRMPKLWVGFLKCVSQTRPHSFPVLLKLPPPQLESTLNKYANLRGPLAAYASQPSLKSSIPRSTLALLGLGNDSHMQQPHISSLNPSDTGSSVHGQTLT